MTWDKVNRELRAVCDVLLEADQKPNSRAAADAIERLQAAREAAGNRYARVYVNHAPVSIPRVIDAQMVTLRTVIDRRIAGPRFDELRKRVVDKVSEIIDAIQMRVGFEARRTPVASPTPASESTSTSPTATPKIESKKTTTLDSFDLLKDAWQKYQIEQGLIPKPEEDPVEIEAAADPERATAIRKQAFDEYRQGASIEGTIVAGKEECYRTIRRLIETKFGPRRYCVAVRGTVIVSLSRTLPYSEMRMSGFTIDVLPPVYVFHDQELLFVFQDPDSGSISDVTRTIAEYSQRRRTRYVDVLAEAAKTGTSTKPFLTTSAVKRTHIHWIMDAARLARFRNFLVLDASLSW